MSRNQRTATILRELQQAWEHDFQPTEVHTFARTGRLSIENALPKASFEAIAVAAKGLFQRPLLPKTHRMEARHSRGIRELALLTTPESIAQKTRSVAVHAPELAIATVWADGMVRYLGRELIALAYTQPGDMLRAHESNHIIVRRMHGTKTYLSVYGKGSAPVAERGVHVSLALDEGFELGVRQTIPSNTLHIYAADNLSSTLAIDPPEYGFNAKATRFSLEFVDSEEWYPGLYA
jgi:hypothetical protein